MMETDLNWISTILRIKGTGGGIGVYTDQISRIEPDKIVINLHDRITNLGFQYLDAVDIGTIVVVIKGVRSAYKVLKIDEKFKNLLNNSTPPKDTGLWPLFSNKIDKILKIYDINKLNNNTFPLADNAEKTVRDKNILSNAEAIIEFTRFTLSEDYKLLDTLSDKMKEGLQLKLAIAHPSVIKEFGYKEYETLKSNPNLMDTLKRNYPTSWEKFVEPEEGDITRKLSDMICSHQMMKIKLRELGGEIENFGFYMYTGTPTLRSTYNGKELHYVKVIENNIGMTGTLHCTENLKLIKKYKKERKKMKNKEFDMGKSSEVLKEAFDDCIENANAKVRSNKKIELYKVSENIEKVLEPPESNSKKDLERKINEIRELRNRNQKTLREDVFTSLSNVL